MVKGPLASKVPEAGLGQPARVQGSLTNDDLVGRLLSIKPWKRRKEQIPEEQIVKLNIHSERQLTCLGPFLRFLHAQHSSYRLVSLRELGVGGDFGECSPALLHHR